MKEQRHRYPVELARTGALGRGVPIATFLIGVFLGAALVKPWDVFSPTLGPSPSRDAGDATAGPTQAPTPSGPPAECAFAGGWRVFALGQQDSLPGDGSTASSAVPKDEPPVFADIENPLRHWLEIEPLTSASGPGDRRIPVVAIVSDRIGGIGYCPPRSGEDDPPSGATLTAWSIDAAGTPVALSLQPAILDRASTIEVEVFIPADQADRARVRWPPGHYVFEVSSPEPDGYARWLGVEILTPPGREPSPS